MRILYHHRTQAEDGQAVHIRSLVRAFTSLGHEVREVALVEKTGESDPSTAGDGGAQESSGAPPTATGEGDQAEGSRSFP